MKAREKTTLQLGLISWFKKRLSTQRELSPEMRELQLEMAEQRNQCQQLQMSKKDSLGTPLMVLTAFTALCACLHAIAPASLSQLPSKAGWLVAAIQAVTIRQYTADFIAARKARRMFFAAAAERRMAYRARRSAAHSAGQPHSMP